MSDASDKFSQTNRFRLPLPRKFGRLRQGELCSNFGPIVDLSAGGLSVHSSRRIRGEVEVQIIGHPLPGPLKAKVVWTRRSGLFSRLVGLEFIDVSPETSKALCAIASSNRIRMAA